MLLINMLFLILFNTTFHVAGNGALVQFERLLGYDRFFAGLTSALCEEKREREEGEKERKEGKKERKGKKHRKEERARHKQTHTHTSSAIYEPILESSGCLRTRYTVHSSVT